MADGNLRIRDGRLEDVPALADIYNDAVLRTTATFDLDRQTVSEREVWFRQFGDTYPILVAEKEGRIVGYCCLTMFRSKPAYAKTAEISVYLDRAFHGQRIGSQLMERILQIARERGFHAIVAGITGGNEASVRLHRKFGFEFVGCFREVGYKFGAWQDVHFYQLVLD